MPIVPKPAAMPRRVAILADDEAVVAELGQIVLTHLGFEVLTAANGREALALFRENRDVVRLVLLDVTMPELDGFQTLREIRALDDRMPAILWSGFGEIVLPESADRLITRFLAKPFTITALRFAIMEATGDVAVPRL